MSEEVECYLNELESLSSKDLYKRLSYEELPFNSDVKWIQDSLSQSLRLLKSGFLPANNITEGGLVKRVWCCLDACFDFSKIKCIRYV